MQGFVGHTSVQPTVNIPKVRVQFEDSLDSLFAKLSKKLVGKKCLM